MNDIDLKLIKLMEEIKELLESYKDTLSNKQKLVRESAKKGFTHLIYVGEINQLRIVINDLEEIIKKGVRKYP